MAYRKTSFVVAGICLIFQANDAPPKLSELFQRWDNWKGHVDGQGGLEIKVKQYDGPAETMSFTGITQINGSLRKRTSTSIVKGKTTSYIDIANPSYHARIRNDNGAFILESTSAITSDEASYRVFNTSEYLSIMQAQRIAWIRDVQPDLVEGTGGTEGDNRWKMTYANPHESVRRLDIIINEKFGWLPEKMLMEIDSAHEPLFVEEVYFYRDSNGEWLWEKKETRQLLSEKVSDVRLVAEAIYDVVAPAPNRKECYLAYYGLPEPKFASNKRIYWLGGLALLSGLLAIVILRNWVRAGASKT